MLDAKDFPDIVDFAAEKLFMLRAERGNVNKEDVNYNILTDFSKKGYRQQAIDVLNIIGYFNYKYCDECDFWLDDICTKKRKSADSGDEICKHFMPACVTEGAI